jgi:hypothetical protein
MEQRSNQSAIKLYFSDVIDKKDEEESNDER